jgi:hypothetical protein
MEPIRYDCSGMWTLVPVQILLRVLHIVLLRNLHNDASYALLGLRKHNSLWLNIMASKFISAEIASLTSTKSEILLQIAEVTAKIPPQQLATIQNSLHHLPHLT